MYRILLFLAGLAVLIASGFIVFGFRNRNTLIPEPDSAPSISTEIILEPPIFDYSTVEPTAIGGGVNEVYYPPIYYDNLADTEPPAPTQVQATPTVLPVLELLSPLNWVADKIDFLNLRARMNIKEGVELDGIKHEAVHAAAVTERVYQDYGLTAVITSGLDGQHKTNSLHYRGLALDFRTRHVPPQLLPNIVADIRRSLGRDYDVVLESDHLHIEYDPKSA